MFDVRPSRPRNAWLCVETATFRFTARSLRKASIFGSAGSISSRDFIWWNCTYRRIQSQYERSVRIE